MDTKTTLSVSKAVTGYRGELQPLFVLRKWDGAPAWFENRGVHYQVIKPHGNWVSTIVSQNGNETFRFEQQDWDLEILENSARFRSLQGNKGPFLRHTYIRANPRPIINLLDGDAPEIQTGGTTFRCNAEDLFTGLLITISDTRNCLLHGELSPNERALRCYEPTFRILRDLLDFADA